jgi:hypothetical protein
MQTKRNFRPRHITPRGVHHVTRQPSDLLIVEVLHRLGPQTVEALFQLLYPLYESKRAFLHRVELLRQLENTNYGGPLLFYPSQQLRAVQPERNNMVLDITARGERFLKSVGRFREHHPITNGKEWKHDLFSATVVSSILLPIKADTRYTFGYPDEVVAELGGRRSFPVPTYRYHTERGEERVREGAIIRPDGLFSITYPDPARRILLVETDCHTEPYRTDNLQRKSHKHTILSYHALLAHGDIRRSYFGEAQIGVLNVFSHPRAMQSAMEVHEEMLGNKGKFMLYQTWEAFGDFFRPPPPRPDLFLNSWKRVCQPPAFISKA